MDKKNLSAKKIQIEQIRIEGLYTYERNLNLQGYDLVAGTDEAGRGPIAGPVVAAAVILPTGLYIEGLNDSKKISSKKRERLYDEIIDNCISYGIKVIDNDEIDKINILQSSFLAMKMAIDEMAISPNYVLVDGWKNKMISIPQINLIKGDSKSASIAAASILAKVYRDRLMEEYDLIYPEYGFAAHKGYPTKRHIQALEEFGVLKIHRKTFTPVTRLL